MAIVPVPVAVGIMDREALAVGGMAAADVVAALLVVAVGAVGRNADALVDADVHG